MKLCLVYNPKDSKFHSMAYCSIFKDMFFALIERFNCKKFVTGDYSAKDIDADIIFFFDPHATHHIEIGGIDKHPAVKIEYWNDIHQHEMKGVNNTTKQHFYKLGQKQRVDRAIKRNIDYIVSPVKYFFYEQLAKYFGDNTKKMLLYFPHAPNPSKVKPFAERKKTVLANGAIHGGWNNGYDFRAWAFEQLYVEFVKHWIFDKKTPAGNNYLDFVSEYAGALALCTPFPVPKYFEIPMAGCVTFAEYHKEYEELGFKDNEHCIYVNKDNFENRIKAFLAEPESYQKIADAGRKLMEENYTAKHFADFIYNHVERHNKGDSV